MAAALEVPEESLNEDSNDSNTNNWGSIQVMQMVVALEHEFNITIPEEQMVNMVSYKLIEAIINDCTRRNESV